MNHHYSFSRAIAWLCALFLIASLPSPLIYATAAAPLPPESPEPGSPNPNPPSQPPPPAAYDEWTVTLQPLSDASQGHLYRGYLQHYGSPADGIYDLQVRLFATPGGDTPIGDAIVYAETPVSAGEFILPLSAEPGNLLLAASWIEISVRPTGRAAGDPFTVIPRLPLQAAQSQPGEPSTPLTDVQPQMPLAPGDFTLLTPSPVNLTCVTSDPTSGLIYAQEDNGTGYYVYDPGVDSWSPLASAPLNSGNNGGAAYQGGKIYTVYTGNNTTMGVYDIASNTWSTMPNGLGGGTGVIASDGTYLYLASYSTFKRYDPVADEWANLTPPSIVIEPWGGMAYWNGRLYVHHGNGATEFAMYEIATGVWTTLPSLPSGAVLGSAIDPVRRVYYAYGSYDGNNWYAFDLDSQSWITETIPFFNVADGGMLYLDRPGFSGVYLIQGEAGFDLARYRDSTPSEGSFAINNGAGYVNVVTVTLDVSAQDPQTGLSYMRFRNEAPWKVLVFQDAYPWNSNALQQSLALNSLPYDQLDSSAMASADLASYPLVIIPSDQPQGFYDTYNANHTRFDDYASQGGTIEFHAAAGGANGGSLTGIPLPAGVNVNVSYQSYNYMLDPAHPLVAGLPNPIYGSLASHGYFSGMPGDAQIISTEGNVPGGHPTLIEFPVGSGKAVLSTQTMEFGWQFGQPVDHILDNMPLYLAAQPWAESAPWVLTPGDGVKTVYGAFRNGAGLWSSVYTDTIILDTQAPQASATCLPEASELFFDVNWSGSDALSGVATYDVQYRLGSGGAWTDWPGLLGTTQTSATFGPASPVTVERGETYSFRVRAHDAAGNVSSYAPAGDCSTYVKLPQIYLPITVRN